MTAGSTAARPRQLPTAGHVQRITLLDLDLDQLERAEELVGLSAKRWDEAPSQGRVLKAVYSVAFDVPLEEAGKLTLRQLQARVDLSTDDDQDQSEPARPSA
jgi:hypothetical protein